MKVAVNGLFLTRPHTGVGQYTRNLVTALAGTRGVDVTVLVPEPVDLPLPKKVKVRVVSPGRRYLGRGLSLDHWERVVAPQAALAAGADIYHTPYPTPPPEVAMPVAMTVHDMIPWQHPYYRRSLRSRRKLKGVLTGIRRADLILTVSRSAADDIVSVADIDPRRIKVSYEGLDLAFTKVPTDPIRKKVLAKHRLTRPYVLYLGGFDYRKNVRRLTLAFGRSGLADSHDLVIAGAVAAPGTALYADYHRLSILLAQAGIAGQTRLLGWLTESEKAAVLSGAGAFVYPSLAEGFGLPVLEALALGTPVATSRIPVMTELFNGAVEFFDPADIDEQAAAIRAVVGTNRLAMKRRGRILATKELTWKVAAARTVQAYGLLK